MYRGSTEAIRRVLLVSPAEPLAISEIISRGLSVTATQLGIQMRGEERLLAYSNWCIAASALLSTIVRIATVPSLTA